MWLVVIGLLLRFTGQSMYKTAFADPLVLAGGISLFAGLAVFALTLFDVIRLSKSRTGPAELWLVSGVFWSIVAGASHLAVTVRMAIESAPLGYGPWNEALIYVALFGFISSFIFGVSARAIRGFLVLKPMYENLNRVALVMIQTGLIVLIVGRFLDLDQAIASVGLVLLRVTFGFSISEIGERALGASGGIGIVGIILFAIVAFQAMSNSAREAYAVRAAAFGQIKFDSSGVRTKTTMATKPAMSRPLILSSCYSSIMRSISA